MPNRLAHESSPYLRQHANNPVDWYPWGREALDRAKRDDKPIFLSIGYSACHWCHVMERESFEDQATADILNAHFINIKVDREERQDLDHIYMSAVQVMTQHGGWPMSVFLTPDLRPFYGGTYFPPEDRHGMPSFKRILTGVSQAWKTRKSEILETASQLTEALKEIQQGAPPKDGSNVDLGLVALASEKALSLWDRDNGGLGSAPKFFHTGDFRVLMRHHFQNGHAESLEAVTSTLKKISCGGIYDHLGGGFHRYSTDAVWLVPHFEKMLYDNALLATTFLEAFQLTGDKAFSKTACEILDYVLREMTAQDGGFFSTQDADSEGAEGKFYVWSEKEVLEILGAELGKTFCEIYQISAQGNWEGTNIPHLKAPLDVIATERGIELNWLEDELANAKRKLLAQRSTRIAPHRDEKLVTSWNGMMLEAMALGYQVLQDPRYLEAAKKTAAFVLEKMREEKKLLHVYKDGVSRLSAYLDDYAAMVLGLTALFESTGEDRWLKAGQELSHVMVDQFWDATENDFYFTAKNHEKLIARPKERHDGATPSATAMATTALARLGRLLQDRKLTSVAEQALQTHASWIRSVPQGSGQFLIALFFLQHAPKEVAITGAAGEEKENLLSYCWSRFAPSRVLAWSSENSDLGLDLLKGRVLANGEPTAFVCEGYVCKAPVKQVDELKKLGV